MAGNARRARAGLDLHLDLGPGGPGHALETALREAVRSGRLPAGARLPGSRSLAADLGISRGTVVQVYAQLMAEGWLVGATGSGTWVADVPVESLGRESRLAEPAGPPFPEGWYGKWWPADLRSGRPDVSSFPRGLWAAGVRRAVASAEARAFDYGEPAGAPALRVAIAGYLARTRGVRATAGSVVITSGFSQGLALLARTLCRLGARAAAAEDPCLPRHRELLRAAGLRVDPLPVDADGAAPAGLRGDTALALLTPAHQYPSGVVLAPGRRAAFTDWAGRYDGYVIEDDYDGEFRYDGQPVGALQALAPDRVVFGGTAAKALAPGMQIGWLVVPPALRGPLLETAWDLAGAVPAIDQLALADLIERGEYDRQVRRMRLAYRRRRAELERRLASVTRTPLAGLAAGLHALLPVGSAERERRLIADGERAGLAIHGLHTNRYWHVPDESRPAALVIGYAAPPPQAWRRSLELLTGLLAAPQRERAKPSHQEG